MTKPKVVTDISDRRMVGKKVLIELDGFIRADGSTMKIPGWVVAQYVEGEEPEQTTILRVMVSGPIIGV
jgi:hypothetical protein